MLVVVVRFGTLLIILNSLEFDGGLKPDFIAGIHPPLVPVILVPFQMTGGTIIKCLEPHYIRFGLLV